MIISLAFSRFMRWRYDELYAKNRGIAENGDRGVKMKIATVIKNQKQLDAYIRSIIE